MARATGRRFLAALCFFFGGITVVLIPILWPLGYKIWKNAKEREREAEKRQEAYEKIVEQT